MPSPSDSNIRKSVPGDAPAPSLQNQLEAARRNPNLNLGKLTLLEEIGHGGMGVVYRAWQSDLQRMVAVKILPANSGKEAGARFLREARLASKLRHPNIVAVHEMGEHHDRPWFSMDLIDGGSLDPLVRGRKLPAKRLMELLRDIARALDYAHKSGVVHRDIKPANVLLSSDGKPFLTDFGLAGDLDESHGRLTLSGALMGTPAYMSPEQARGRKGMPDARTDIFSLGAVLYEGLTGHTAVPRGDLMEMVSSILNAEPEAPTARAPGVPKDAETICLKCLQKDPERRYQTAAELADDVDRFLKGEPISARPSTLLQKAGRRAANPFVLAGAAAALLLVLVIGWLVKHEIDRDARDREKERVIADLRKRLSGATTDEERSKVAREIEAATGEKVDVPRPVDTPGKPVDPVVKPPDPGGEIPKPPPVRSLNLDDEIRLRLGKGEFAEAMKLVGLAGSTPEEKSWQERARARVEEAAKSAFLEIDRQALALADAGDLAGAEAAWGEALKIGLPSITTLVEDRIAAVRAKATAGNREAALPKLGPLRDEVLATCAKRRYADAVKSVDALEKDEPSLAADLSKIREAVKGAAAVLPAAPKGAGKLKGRRFPVGSETGEITGGSESKLEAKVGPSTMGLDYSNLPADLIADLAMAGGASPEQAGAFLLFEGKADLAAKAWAGSARRAEMDQLALEFQGAVFQRESREALAQLFKAAEEKNTKKLKDLLAQRAKYADTPAWRDAATKIEDIAYAAEAGVSEEPFAVKPHKSGAELEWRYDFSRPEQLKDWLQVDESAYTAVKSFGVSLDGGAVVLTNSVLEFAAPLEGDMRLSADISLKSIGKSSNFGVFLGGYVLTLSAEDEAKLYSPGEQELDSAPDSRATAGKTWHLEMSVGRAGVRVSFDGRQFLKAALVETPLPLPPRFWTLRDVVLAVDNVALAGQLAPDWSTEAKARQEMATRAALPSAAGKPEMLLEGKDLGRFTSAENGTWDPADGAMRGTSPSDDVHAELHLAGEKDRRRNLRLKLQYLVHSGRSVELGLRMESDGLVHFHLPTDVTGKWRDVEVVLAEELTTCVVDGVVHIAPSLRPGNVGAGGLRIMLQGSTVSFRGVSMQELRGLPEAPKWTPVWVDKVQPKALKLEGLDWDPRELAVRGQGTLEWAAKWPAMEVKWQMGATRGSRVRVEVRGEKIFEYLTPERPHDLSLRLRGDVVDVLWNGVTVVRDRKLGKGTGPIRLVTSGPDAIIGAMLERASAR